jgi:hypothetical protein
MLAKLKELALGWLQTMLPPGAWALVGWLVNEFGVLGKLKGLVF